MDSKAIWYLENIDLFELFCPYKIKNLEKAGHMKAFKKGEFIYLPNTAASHIYFIDKGHVKIGNYSSEGREIVKSTLQAGEIFGELALLGEDRRNDFAQALDDVLICPMTLDKMHALMRDNKDFSLKITKLIGLRLVKLERRLETLVFKDARTRIVEYIKDLAAEKGKKTQDGIEVVHYLTHQDIANLTATSRQKVTTVLNELKEENLVSFDRKTILIKQLKMLK